MYLVTVTQICDFLSACFENAKNLSYIPSQAERLKNRVFVMESTLNESSLLFLEELATEPCY
jgi:hypothetical protein